LLNQTSNNAAAIKPISIIQRNARMCLLTRGTDSSSTKKKGPELNKFIYWHVSAFRNLDYINSQDGN
jgi:hypothetical protein